VVVEQEETSDDEDIDAELDFRKTKAQKTNNHNQSANQNTFSRRYVDVNRNQSIMRYQDILDQSKKAVNTINKRVSLQLKDQVSEQQQTPAIQEATDDFVPTLLGPDAPIMEKRTSKYMKRYQQQQQQQSGVNEPQVGRDRQGSYNSSVVPARKGSSVSSKREFGAKEEGKKSKPGVLRKIWAWGK